MNLFELSGEIERLIDEGRIEDAMALRDEHKHLIPENVMTLANGAIVASNMSNFEKEWKMAIEDKRIEKSNEKAHYKKVWERMFGGKS
jgi:hypothetical protein